MLTQQKHIETGILEQIRNLDDLATKKGLIRGIFTWSALRKCEDFNPKQTDQYLCETWAKAIAELEELNINIIGIHICEPLPDGTPHWHVLMFFKPEHKKVIYSAFALSACFLSDSFNKDESSKHNDQRKIGSLSKLIAWSNQWNLPMFRLFGDVRSFFTSKV